MRRPGVEPGAKAWEASMLPIHHWRSLVQWHKSRRGGAGVRSSLQALFAGGNFNFERDAQNHAHTLCKTTWPSG